MRRILIFSRLFWPIFSLLICIEAYRLKLGTIYMPGPGFFPFCIGVVMFLLSIAALVQSLKSKEPELGAAGREPFRWWNIIIILLAMLFYALTLQSVGFLINTFVFVMLLLKIVEPQSWKTAIIGGLITALAADLVFNVIFQAHIPSGILGF